MGAAEVDVVRWATQRLCRTLAMLLMGLALGCCFPRLHSFFGPPTPSFVTVADAWAGQGVIALYFDAPLSKGWAWPYLYVAYLDTFNPLGSDLRNLTMDEFRGPLWQSFPNSHYVEIPANSALIRFVNNLTGATRPAASTMAPSTAPHTTLPPMTTTAPASPSNNASIQDGMYVITSPGIYYFTGEDPQMMRTDAVYDQGCPGAPPINVVVQCSSHGACNIFTQECSCEDEWTNPACEGLMACNKYMATTVKGTVIDQSPTTYSASECCAKCDENPTCVAALYNYDQFNCTLLNATEGNLLPAEASEALLYFQDTTPAPSVP